MFEQVEEIMEHIIDYISLAIELVGVIIILITFIKSLIGQIKKNPESKHELIEGLCTALGFMMCAEVLKTVVIRDTKSIIVLASTMLIRAGMTFLLHWEKKNE